MLFIILIFLFYFIALFFICNALGQLFMPASKKDDKVTRLGFAFAVSLVTVIIIVLSGWIVDPLLLGGIAGVLVAGSKLKKNTVAKKTGINTKAFIGLSLFTYIIYPLIGVAAGFLFMLLIQLVV